MISGVDTPDVWMESDPILKDLKSKLDEIPITHWDGINEDGMPTGGVFSTPEGEEIIQKWNERIQFLNKLSNYK